MSGYCPDCGNTICLCDELNEENTASIQDFYEKYKVLQKENELLRECVYFYANKRNYDGAEIDPVDHEELSDKWGDVQWTGGKLARECLAKLGES